MVRARGDRLRHRRRAGKARPEIPEGRQGVAGGVRAGTEGAAGGGEGWGNEVGAREGGEKIAAFFARPRAGNYGVDIRAQPYPDWAPQGSAPVGAVAMVSRRPAQT